MGKIYLPSDMDTYNNKISVTVYSLLNKAEKVRMAERRGF